MSRQINQPINQVKLTNVAVVKYTFKGKRFEIACYRNKVMDYRSGFEKDLSEVLQSERIFTNVSKGQFAKASDLEQAFNTKDESIIAKLILDKGKFELSDLERQQLLDNAMSQICTHIADACVHPHTKRRYTDTQIRTALSNYHLQPHKPFKKQYLDAIKYLKQSLPLERAKMELSLRYPVEQEDAIVTALRDIPHDLVVPSKLATAAGRGGGDKNDKVKVFQVDPSLYRQINDLAQQVKGRLEILQQGVVADAPPTTLDDPTLLRGGWPEEHSSDAQPLPQRAAPPPPDNDAVKADQGDESDEEQQQLLNKLHAVRIGRTDDESNNGAPSTAPSISSVKLNRKQLRQQQKKVKKDQRRHEEEEEGGSGHSSDDSETGDSSQQPNRAGSVAVAAPPASAAVVEASNDADARSCNTCGGAFRSATEYRAHFRSDWHRFNQQLKLKGVPPVTEDEFQLCDASTFFGKPEE